MRLINLISRKRKLEMRSSTERNIFSDTRMRFITIEKDIFDEMSFNISEKNDFSEINFNEMRRSKLSERHMFKKREMSHVNQIERTMLKSTKSFMTSSFFEKTNIFAACLKIIHISLILTRQERTSRHTLAVIKSTLIINLIDDDFHSIYSLDDLSDSILTSNQSNTKFFLKAFSDTNLFDYCVKTSSKNINKTINKLTMKNFVILNQQTSWTFD
jgi:hypothetical protein